MIKSKTAKKIAIALLVCLMILGTGNIYPVHAQENGNSLLDTPTVLSNTGEVAVDEINFPDEAFRNYVKQFDSDGNNSFTQTELNAVGTMVIENNISIKGLKGLEHFTKLTRLYCYDTGITSLDVSKNTALSYLDCGSTGITSLDVSKNTALTDLNCSNTGITSLDVSKNTVLTGLNCSNTGITSLDVSKNTALTYLNCRDTKIISLDLSNNVNLSNVYLSSNSLRKVDITSDSVALQSIDANMDGARISNLKNATLSADKKYFKNYAIDQSITYDYDCKNQNSDSTTMHVILTLFGDNAWLSPLTIENWIYGQEAKLPTASSRYGTPTYSYSDSKDGTFTNTVPTNSGTWYAKAIVAGNSTYSSLESEAIAFTISPKSLTDTSITSTAVKNDSDTLVIKDGTKTLVKDTDYKVVTKEANGKVTLTISGIANYQGVIEKSYAIPVIEKPGDKLTDNKNPNSPKTGDTTNAIFYLGLIVLSAYVVNLGLKKKERINK